MPGSFENFLDDKRRGSPTAWKKFLYHLLQITNKNM